LPPGWPGNVKPWGMTMTTEPLHPVADDAGLDALFAAARAAEAPVPGHLLARVLADADAHMPPSVPVSAPTRAVAPRGWLAGLLDMLGGRGAVAGLAAAGLAGVWIGFVQPVDLGRALLPSSAVDAVELYPADIDQWADLVAPETVTEG